MNVTLPNKYTIIMTYIIFRSNIYNIMLFDLVQLFFLLNHVEMHLFLIVLVVMFVFVILVSLLFNYIGYGYMYMYLIWIILILILYDMKILEYIHICIYWMIQYHSCNCTYIHLFLVLPFFVLSFDIFQVPQILVVAFGHRFKKKNMCFPGP